MRTCRMLLLALVRDILRPAPWEQLLQDCALPLPRVMNEPTCNAATVLGPRGWSIDLVIQSWVHAKSQSVLVNVVHNSRGCSAL